MSAASLPLATKELFQCVLTDPLTEKRLHTRHSEKVADETGGVPGPGRER